MEIQNEFRRHQGQVSQWRKKLEQGTLFNKAKSPREAMSRVQAKERILLLQPDEDDDLIPSKDDPPEIALNKKYAHSINDILVKFG